MKARLIVMILCAVLTASFLGLMTSSNMVAAIQVPSSQYPTIQAAINHASPYDTIIVAPGNYTENVVINQTVTLMGSGRSVTFVKALSRSKPVFEIEVNNVNLTGFTIQDGLRGISASGCNSSIISDNSIISNINEGIYLNLSHHDIIANNTISLNKVEGLFLLNSAHNLINNNVVTKNEYTGIDLLYANQNRISNNTISFHTNVTLHDQGVWMESSNNNTVDGNILLYNAYSIDMIAAGNNTVHSNIIARGYHGVDLDDSDNNLFFHNDFLENAQQVSSYRSTNTWYNGSLSEGNYWSDYTGQDDNGDGIGDVPYVIDAGNSDIYPLISRWRPSVLDFTPPVTTDNYDGLWHSQDFVITLAAEDFSGINETYYRINDAPSVSNVTSDGQPLITTESANNKLEYWSVDNATNEEPHKILTGIKLDKTPPYGSITINDNDAYASSAMVTLTLFGNDLLSGISQMRFSNDETTWSAWETYATTKNWLLSVGDGLKAVYVQFSDNVGLVSQTYDDTIFLDTTPPAISVLSPEQDSEIRSSEVTIQWNGTDTGAGIDYFEIRIDDGPWTNTGLVQDYMFTGLSDGAHSVDVRAFDKLGLASETSVSFTVNTSLIGGPGYIEEIILVVIAAIVIMVVLLILTLKKKRGLKSESSLSTETRG